MATVIDSTLEAFKTLNKWVTARELFDFMVNNGYYVGNSKTPKDTISATCVRFSQDGLLKERKRPGQKAKEYCIDNTEVVEEKNPSIRPGEETTATYHERDLHPLMANYLWSKGVYCKTIFQERSTRFDQAQKWVHPDIVGVEFVGLEKQSVKSLMKAVNTGSTMCICSYELKKEINTDYSLKQSFFQALSNSSWANLGYLVALDINPELMDEIERLNQAFGIGVIKLAPHPIDTAILFPARQKDLDYRTIDKLCSINPEFDQFISHINTVIGAQDAYIKPSKDSFERFCDKKFASDAEIDKYCKVMNIPN